MTDSRLMLDSMTKWIHGWKRKGWKTAGGDPVKNQDLVRALDAEIARHEAVRWHWVRGHETGAEHAHKALNDRADRLAVAASHAASVRARTAACREGGGRPLAHRALRRRVSESVDPRLARHGRSTARLDRRTRARRPSRAAP